PAYDELREDLEKENKKRRKDDFGTSFSSACGMGEEDDEASDPDNEAIRSPPSRSYNVPVGAFKLQWPYLCPMEGIGFFLAVVRYSSHFSAAVDPLSRVCCDKIHLAAAKLVEKNTNRDIRPSG
ncbi:hypothetical protein HAX54_015801, partial [Datura stramonium]|nr:hypothetical protein [Datura stramonium]